MISIDFNTFAAGLIHAVYAKVAGLHVALHGNFSGTVSSTDPAKAKKTRQVL